MFAFCVLCRLLSSTSLQQRFFAARWPLRMQTFKGWTAIA
jgi:hypothetical protein